MHDDPDDLGKEFSTFDKGDNRYSPDREGRSTEAKTSPSRFGVHKSSTRSTVNMGGGFRLPRRSLEQRLRSKSAGARRPSSKATPTEGTKGGNLNYS